MDEWKQNQKLKEENCSTNNIYRMIDLKVTLCFLKLLQLELNELNSSSISLYYEKLGKKN